MTRSRFLPAKRIAVCRRMGTIGITLVGVLAL